MNIESSNINRTGETQTTKTRSLNNNKDRSVSFADELKETGKEEELKIEEAQIEPESEAKTETETKAQEEVAQSEKTEQEDEEKNIKPDEDKPLEQEENQKFLQEDTQNPETEHLGKALENLTSIVEELNQSEDKLSGIIKKEDNSADNNNVINNDLNIQENKDLLPQMNPNMNFSGNGQPFSSFMNNDSGQEQNPKLSSSAQDLAEEAAILSTMAENIAIANKNQALKDTRTISNEEGVKKVDSQTGIKVENIVKYDTVIMNQADVEVFANLVENGEVNMNNLAPKAAEKSVQVSKTLADMLAKSMENNQPVRIDFDNNISVIIRISRDGKISADFLPSSQVAEAYLKENLPLLRQRFDNNNIDYESLNQKERRNPDKEENRKKDRSNE